MTSGSMCALIQAYFSVVCLDRHNKIQLYDKSNLDNGQIQAILGRAGTAINETKLSEFAYP